jgi:hypothetical protein
MARGNERGTRQRYRFKSATQRIEGLGRFTVTERGDERRYSRLDGQLPLTAIQGIEGVGGHLDRDGAGRRRYSGVYGNLPRVAGGPPPTATASGRSHATACSNSASAANHLPPTPYTITLSSQQSHPYADANYPRIRELLPITSGGEFSNISHRGWPRPDRWMARML